MIAQMCRTSVFLTVLLILSNYSCATGVASRADLEIRYNDLKVAIASRSPKAIEAILAEGFRSVDVKGTSRSAEEMIAKVLSIPVDGKKVSSTILFSVTGDERQAIVQQHYEMNSTYKIVDTDHRLQLISESTDLWIKQSNIWLLKNTTTNETLSIVDDKISYHLKRGSI